MLAIEVPDHLDHRSNAHGGVVVLNRKTGQWHALNTTAGLLWRHWSEGSGFEQSVAAVAGRHPDVPADRLRADAARLLGDLVRRGLVRADPASCPAGEAVTMAEAPAPARSASGRFRAVVAFPFLVAAALLARAPFRAACAAVSLTRPWCRSDVPVERATRIVAAVERAARRYPFRAACMEQSLAAVLMAALTGRRLTWCIGAVPDPYRFHAWVEAAGAPVVAPGDTADPHRFLRVLAL
ncbi:lasso peptide biosynthesis B2 protein [Actinomadura chibensis]|uniref:Lasso peptide biosynthesis B2 protein n=1 Tax=Actinomadura chibensis TaxID=392828 RepID=A0A5D0NJ49_9ACTN|nr:lasso peptide biosynthesis B2 protein [Actinomadura chibensis]TYB44221.1 lasso peptide biosynthesis B2 protein [Actinomadura chibensis]